MFDSLLASLLSAYSLAGLVGLASCLMGASMYDLKEAKVHRKAQLHPYAKANRHKPVISIIIYVDNPRQALLKCLESIRRSSYRNYEIVVVDDTPVALKRENTAVQDQIICFKTRYPKATLKLLRRRINSGRAAAINAAIKKWARGDLIMILDADSTLDKYALRNAGRHFTNNDVAVVIPSMTIIWRPSIVAVYEQFNQLLRLSTAKFTSLVGLTRVSAASGFIYRRIGSPAQPVAFKYGSDVLVYTVPAASWTSLWRASYHQRLALQQGVPTMKNTANYKASYRSKIYPATRLVARALLSFITIVTPGIIAYLFYLAVYFKQSTLYGLSWIIFSVMLLGIIWTRGHLDILNRLRLTVLVPVAYGLFFIMSLVRVGLLAVYAVKNKSIIWGQKQPFSR